MSSFLERNLATSVEGYKFYLTAFNDRRGLIYWYLTLLFKARSIIHFCAPDPIFLFKRGSSKCLIACEPQQASKPNLSLIRCHIMGRIKWEKIPQKKEDRFAPGKSIDQLLSMCVKAIPFYAG